MLKNMKKIRSELEEESEFEDSTLIQLCSSLPSHSETGHKTFHSITKYIIDIHKYFRNHYHGAWLKECNDHLSPLLWVHTK